MTEDSLVMIVRSTSALISPSSWQALIRWKVHHRFDKDWWRNRESDSRLVGTGRQISASNHVQCRGLGLHKNTSILSDGQKYTLNSKFSSQPWSLLVNVNTTFPIFCLMWLSAISSTPREFGIGNMKHQRSHQCSQIIPESEGSQGKVVQWMERRQQPHPFRRGMRLWKSLRVVSHGWYGRGDEGLLGQDVSGTSISRLLAIVFIYLRISIADTLLLWLYLNCLFYFSVVMYCSHVIGQGISSVVQSVMGAISCR